jgi:hypothetical protein
VFELLQSNRDLEWLDLTDNAPPAWATKSIPLADDFGVPDADFRRFALAGASQKTGQRYDRQGLPFIYIRGEKWRPVRAGMAWIASRITIRTEKRRAREDAPLPDPPPADQK